MKLCRLVLPFLFAAVSLLSAPGVHAEWVWNKGTGWIDPLGLNPKVPDQRYKLAISMMLSGDYESSVKVFESILKEHPDSDLAEPCHYNIGQAYYLAGKYKKAFKAYERLLEKFPGIRITGLIHQKEFEAGTALMQEKPKASVVIFETIIEHNPQGPLAADSQVKIADAFFLAEDFVSAEAAYRAVLENYPRSEWAPYSLYRIPLSKLSLEARRDRDMENLWKARDGFEEYIGSYPNGTLVEEAKAKIHEVEGLIAQKNYAIAEFYLRKKKPAAAMIYLSRITKRFPNTRWAEKSQDTIDFLKKINAVKK
ncbi:MAG: outer membrane protein assembly factor BamD [Planctomycetes bacterium]|nr:outer membrane protein assembly factor BamD [Planctomycetota bacterium]